MNIIITLQGGGFHTYDLDVHDTVISEGALQVFRVETDEVVTVYAPGEWLRLEFDRLGMGYPRQKQHIWNNCDD